ncbi:UDP-N-acetylmuramoyl-tripeptide--D-alanyl-D-alanine ligase [Paenibacillus eucommiae]|uniref:UDP-N-acetylmuramoyl-tripeptide--D-alanyl-D-alanine ligase n=1 Tax=Paenibacillus eucommiae TaxID=1355755 RepID=A0ABS4IRX0_9BACL|nr:UDP-N-acetylmuramoyl-tripeptide--D-alanyl-D-alanine ligase [Paenibacillus eucommiae]MBP1989875.1 UDP-N-acetylmuramoyl-tripeptide--D-alanyl-D-alanine ligase [Paenibacillus eucommiae]
MRVTYNEFINCSLGDDDLKQFKSIQRPVIAITGSAGKTTTKEMIASILQKKCTVFKTRANMNLPNFIYRQKQRIQAKHQAIVLEYGMSKKGHIKRSCQIIKPNIGVVTTVGNAHIGHFGGSVKKLAKTKSELIKGMNKKGLLFLNADNKNSKYLKIKRFKGTIYKVGIHKNANYKAHTIAYTTKGMSFKVRLNNRDEQFYIPIFGEHNVYNALFAIAVSHRLGISPDVIRHGLRTYERPKSRLMVYPLINNVQLIDDTYSANPQAVEAAIDVLTHIGKHHKIAVLGNMLELGSYAVKGHASVGSYAAKKRIDHLLTYGDLARYIYISAVKSGFPSSKAKHFNDRASLHSYLKSIIKPNSTILVKGSHKMKMNQTVGFIRNGSVTHSSEPMNVPLQFIEKNSNKIIKVWRPSPSKYASGKSHFTPWTKKN